MGNLTATKQLRSWAEKWINGAPEQKAVLLHGPAGVGKTSTAHALATDMEWEVIELNASDQRTADAIERIAGSASRMGTLVGMESKGLSYWMKPIICMVQAIVVAHRQLGT